MRRESTDQVAAVARRRLEQLGREMGRDAPAVIREPGRHSRSRTPGPGERISAWREHTLPELAGSIRLRVRHLAVLASVAVIALAITGWWTLRGSAAPVPVAPATTDPSAQTALPSSAVAVEPSPGAAPAARESAGMVVVDIAGRVRRPGVATLPAGSRVIDALRKAGGARAGTDLSTLNLARVLVDGEQILVGAAPSGAAASGPSAPAPGADPAGATVNINTADASALEALPGIGPVTAQKIADWRTEHGTFRAIDELLEVDGIGPKTLADLAPHVTL